MNSGMVQSTRSVNIAKSNSKSCSIENRLAASSVQPVTEKRAKILIVDDENDILETLKLTLTVKLEHIEIITAVNALEALKVIKSADIDLMITDYRMPGMDGLQLLQQVAKIAPKVKRILMTAYPDVELAAAGLNDHGISYFISKPFDPLRFPQQVASCLLEQRRAAACDELARSAVDAARWWHGDGRPVFPF